MGIQIDATPEVDLQSAQQPSPNTRIKDGVGIKMGVQIQPDGFSTYELGGC